MPLLVDSLAQASPDCVERHGALPDGHGAELGEALTPPRRAIGALDTEAAADCRALFTSVALPHRCR
ncbi:hypothetical protein [Roseateles sp.]|uniref:hypothetical protein n=1 Tax=Roseateles sp. TaxID=1971397 RepID=UPI0025E1F909|nr:hypothetical protein [Roseateles sp.]MBV8034356.1 hypothetical protein [Roseateles sp.]